MEVFAMGLAIAFLVSLAERRERRAMFAPAPCRHCSMWVRFKRDGWIHEDGSLWARWPQFDYVAFPDSPLHPATPRALWWRSR